MTNRRIFVVNWIDHDGTERQTRFHREYDAIVFQDSLAAEGLPFADYYDI